MSLLRRRTLLRRLFAAMERVASNIGLIREAGKEFRLFSHEEVTLVRQLAESRQRIADMREARAEQTRQLHSVIARQVAEAIQDVEARHAALIQRQQVLLSLCRELLEDGGQPSAAAVAPAGGGGGGGGGQLDLPGQQQQQQASPAAAVFQAAEVCTAAMTAAAAAHLGTVSQRQSWGPQQQQLAAMQAGGGAAAPAEPSAAEATAAVRSSWHNHAADAAEAEDLRLRGSASLADLAAVAAAQAHQETPWSAAAGAAGPTSKRSTPGQPHAHPASQTLLN